MRNRLAVLVASAAILSLPAGYAAAEHIVTPEAVQARLAEATTLRAQNLATVHGALATPLAREAAASVGADLARVRAGVGTLSDSELQDLAARASVLQSDPVAGMDRDMRLLVMVALILVIIIMLVALL